MNPFFFVGGDVLVTAIFTNVNYGGGSFQVAIDGGSYANVVYGQTYNVKVSLKSKMTSTNSMGPGVVLEVDCAITNPNGLVLSSGSFINAINGITSGTLALHVDGVFTGNPFDFGGSSPGSFSDPITGPIGNYTSKIEARSNPGPSFVNTSVEVITILS